MEDILYILMMVVEHGIPKLVLPSLGLKHRLHASFEKSLIERAIQYFKDR
jgi:hypothetical protein